MSAAQRAASNMQQRQALLASAPRYTKNLGTFTSAGSTTRVKLFNVGVLTKLRLFVQVAVTIGVATAVASKKAPYNMISRLRLSDFDNTDRVNASGFQLFVWNCVRARTYYGANNESAVAVFTNPSVPTAVGAQTIAFFIEVPVAYDVDNPIVQLQDLRGSILSQTAVGEMYLSIDWNQSLVSVAGDVDSVYSGAGTTTVVPNGTNYISCQVWQDFLFPQNVGGQVPLPFDDLQTVYEAAGFVKSTDNIAVGQEKLLNYPNVRSVIGFYANYIQAGTLTQGAVGTLRVIANGNNIIQEDSELSQLFKQRLILNSDILPGVYFKSHRERPIETVLFGNVQLGMTPLTAGGGNQYVEVMTEAFWVKGTALPGLQQAG